MGNAEYMGKSVGIPAMEMVKEVKRQFDTIPGLLEGTPGHGPPDHARCIVIFTDASLCEMVAPAVLVMSTPLLFGIFLGVDAVAGLLAGAISSSIQMAISASNTGGAWDNAKKYVEKGPSSSTAWSSARAPRSTRLPSSVTPSAIPSRIPPAPRSTSS